MPALEPEVAKRMRILPMHTRISVSEQGRIFATVTRNLFLTSYSYSRSYSSSWQHAAQPNSRKRLTNDPKPKHVSGYSRENAPQDSTITYAHLRRVRTTFIIHLTPKWLSSRRCDAISPLEGYDAYSYRAVIDQ